MFILSRYGNRHQRTLKNEQIKKQNSFLTSGCIKTRDETHKIFILVGMLFNYALCHKIAN